MGLHKSTGSTLTQRTCEHSIGQIVAEGANLYENCWVWDNPVLG